LCAAARDGHALQERTHNRFAVAAAAAILSSALIITQVVIHSILPDKPKRQSVDNTCVGRKPPRLG